MFVDHAQIIVKAGDGGRGCVAFAQPPYTRYPYPDGGDGGDGGDVLIRPDPNVATLLDFQFHHEFKAGSGRHGGGNTKTGKRGEAVVIRAPVGTVVYDAETDQLLRDLCRAGEELVVAHGGRGGWGNATHPHPSARTASNARRPPNRPSRRRAAMAAEATAGTAGEQRRLRLELKLIADVGLVGFPNAGKSSLLSRVSTAHPKIAAYPFTTRYPVLGVVTVDERGQLVACDIPGLIEGAHQGKGLGIQFLRHIERTRVLVHLIDMAAVDGRDPVEAFHQLNRELASYSDALPAKPQLIAANKMDLPDARERLPRFRRAVPHPVWPISCATGKGIPALLDAVWKTLHSL